MAASTGQVLTFKQRFVHGFRPFTANFLAIAALGVVFTSPAQAQPATCDPLYWNSLKAKAWSEAEREIEQNQTYIYKSDSILEYTCFDRFLSVLAGRARDLFSESTQWSAVVGPNMPQALQQLVGDSLDTYVNQNFGLNNAFLGGFSSINGYDPAPVTRNTNWTCDNMGRVWMAAKCQDIANSSTGNNKANTSGNTDFFFMSTYETNDRRQYPTACAIANTWANQLSVAGNDANQYPKETFNVYSRFFNSTSCNNPPNPVPNPEPPNPTYGSGAIPTGIIVKRSGIADYNEVICVNPGCAATRTGTCQ